MIKTIRLKVKRNSYPWLNLAASEVNQVWNWANSISEKAVRTYCGKAKWLSGYDLNNLSAGASKYFLAIGSSTIQRVNCELASNRAKSRKVKLSWRKTWGTRRSLGWVPFKSASLKLKENSIVFCGKRIRAFEIEKLRGLVWRDGQFSQDSMGDWWLCLPVVVEKKKCEAESDVVGIDLGIKDVATTSDGDTLKSGRFYRDIECEIAKSQMRGHKRQAKRLHRRASRRRKDALHKFTTEIVGKYRNIFVGNVSSSKLAKTRMSKAVLDSGWGMLKQMLLYKGEYAGSVVRVVNEAYTTRACSECGSLSGPQGLRGLSVREWQCIDCGSMHDRDVNAAKNIAKLGSRLLTSVCGNEQVIAWKSGRKNFNKLTTKDEHDR